MIAHLIIKHAIFPTPVGVVLPEVDVVVIVDYLPHARGGWFMAFIVILPVPDGTGESPSSVFQNSWFIEHDPICDSA